MTRAKYRFGAAKMFNQFPRLGRTEAGRHRNGEPFQNMGCGGGYGIGHGGTPVFLSGDWRNVATERKLCQGKPSQATVENSLLKSKQE